MKNVLAIIWFVAEFFIQFHNWVTFLDRRYTKSKTAILATLCCIVLVSVTLCLFKELPLRSFVVFFTYISIIHLLFKDKLYVKFCVHLGYFVCTILAEVVAMMIAKYLYNLDSFDVSEESISNLLWQITAYLLIIIFNVLGTIVLRKKKPYENKDAVRLLVLFVAFQAFICSCVLSFIIQFENAGTYFIWIMSIIYMFSVAASIVMYKIIKTSALKALEAEYIKKESEIKDKHFGELKEQYVEYRNLRHDFTNHLRIIREMKDSESIIEYADAIQSRLDKNDFESYCDNLTLDALLVLKKREALQKDIKIKYEICNLSDLKVNDFDMCTIVSNLLDNAIEAADKTEVKYIDLRIVTKMGRLIITVKNSSPEVGDCLTTTKQDYLNHGIGVESIRTTAEKYNGDYAFKYENSEFVAVVNLVM